MHKFLNIVKPKRDVFPVLHAEKRESPRLH